MKKGMKKIMALMLAVMMVCAVAAVPVAAGELIETDYFTYDVLEDGTAEIARYWGPEEPEETITIPAEVGGHTVSSIGESAFSVLRSVKTIVIPDSVTKIGGSAFESCESLESVNIPDGVASIGEDAFSDCISLKSLDMPKSVESIGDMAFLGCTSLSAINVDAENPNYKSVDGVLFTKDGTRLISYPAGKSNKAYAIPDGVTSTDMFAFAYNNSLESLGIPESLAEISDLSFESCSALKEINVAEGNAVFSSADGVLLNKDKTELILYPAGRTDESYTVPENVKKIGGTAFFDCDNLRSVAVGDNVEEISYSTFALCDNLESVKLSKNLKAIPYRCFADCPALNNVVIPSGVTSIGEGAFVNAFGLKTITIPKTVTEIGWAAFANTEVETIFYDGSKEEWDNIDIKQGNEGISWYAVVFPSQSDMRLGDLSGDGNVTTVDALNCIKAAVGITKLDANQTKAADVDGDGKVTTADALLILKYSVGIIKKFPVEA